VFQDLRAVTKDFAAVMLSGQSHFTDAGTAAKLGYGEILDKAEVDKLPDIVRDLYFQQLTQLVSRPVIVVELAPARRSVGWRHRPAMSLQSLELIDAEYTPVTAWHTYLQVSAGQSVTREVVLTVERRVQLAAHSKTLIKSTVGGKALGIVESKLEGTVEDVLSETVELSSLLTKTYTVTHALPQPESTDHEYVRARNYQYAPVFQRYRGVVLISCKQCSGQTLHTVELLAATGRYTSRHLDTRSSGKQDVVVTGTIHDA
jgi:hypothetical protein